MTFIPDPLPPVPERRRLTMADARMWGAANGDGVRGFLPWLNWLPRPLALYAKTRVLVWAQHQVQPRVAVQQPDGSWKDLP